MKRQKIFLMVLITLLFTSLGCGSNRPIPPPSLAREADSCLKRFQEEFSTARYHQARQSVQRAALIYSALDRDREISLSLNNLGAVQERLDDKAGAENSYREAIALARKTGSAGLLVTALNNLAGMLAAGQPGEARVLAEEALELSGREGREDARPRALYNLAECDFTSGNYDGVRDRCLRALDLAREGGAAGVESACLALLARVEFSRGRFGESLRFAKSALEIDRGRSDPFAIARDYELTALIREKNGDSEGARSDRSRAMGIYRFLDLEPKGDPGLVSLPSE